MQEFVQHIMQKAQGVAILLQCIGLPRHTQLGQDYVNAVCDRAEQEVRDSAVLVVLSDKGLEKGKLPIPAAMAVGAVQKRLVDNNLRCDTNIVVETATARDPHQFAVLLGFGATAIYPYPNQSIC